MTHQLMRITTLRPWCELEAPDSRVIFRTAAGRWLLFHTTTCEAADHILARGFEDHTCRIGFQARPSTHAVYFGGVPAIPVSVDYFDARVMTAASIAWMVIEAPPDAWPHAAVNHQQDPTWPLYQVCYRAAQVNTWPRRRLPVEDVLDFRPSLVAKQLKYLHEAVHEGWLDPRILTRVKCESPNNGDSDHGARDLRETASRAIGGPLVAAARFGRRASAPLPCATRTGTSYNGRALRCPRLRS